MHTRINFFFFLQEKDKWWSEVSETSETSPCHSLARLVQATSLSICCVHTSNTHTILVRLLPQDPYLQLGEWRILSGHSRRPRQQLPWPHPARREGSACCPYLVLQNTMPSSELELSTHPIHRRKSQRPAVINAEYFRLFRSFHLKAPFSQGASERLRRRLSEISE